MSITDERQSAYIRASAPDGGGVDREAILHKRRKSAMRSLLEEFDTEIAPHFRGDQKAVRDFKKHVREKLNALTWEAIELTKLGPGESLNEHAVDLAGQLAFDANGGQRDQ
jgi:hypothetical protein